jgi:hypothetical protein
MVHAELNAQTGQEEKAKKLQACPEAAATELGPAELKVLPGFAANQRVVTAQDTKFGANYPVIKGSSQHFEVAVIMRMHHDGIRAIGDSVALINHAPGQG